MVLEGILDGIATVDVWFQKVARVLTDGCYIVPRW